jgi:hypothetical protein
MRKFDDVDWRAVEKPMNELEVRLPVKFVISPEEVGGAAPPASLSKCQEALHAPGVQA